MHPYAQRNVRVWHRRFSPQGWSIRVFERLPPQRLQLPQHLRSAHIPPCLHRWHHLRRLRGPAHLRPRQVRRDVGLIQVRDCLWRETVGDPSSKFSRTTQEVSVSSVSRITSLRLAGIICFLRGVTVFCCNCGMGRQVRRGCMW
jgi:hypothetical protein